MLSLYFWKLFPRDVLPTTPKSIEDHKIIKYPIHILQALLKFAT